MSEPVGLVADDAWSDGYQHGWKDARDAARDILASRDARLAAVEALADEWERLGDEDPYDAGDPGGYAADLRAALHPDPSEASTDA